MKVTLRKTPIWKLRRYPGVVDRFGRGECLFCYIYCESGKFKENSRQKANQESLRGWSSLSLCWIHFLFVFLLSSNREFWRSPSLSFYWTHLPSTQRPYTGTPLLLFHVATHDSARETWSVSSMTTQLREQWPRAGGHQCFAPQPCWWRERACRGVDRACGFNT